MGRSTESDICTNIVQVGDCTTFYDREQELNENFDEDDLIGEVFLSGWTIAALAEDCGRNGRLYGIVLQKVDGDITHKVYMINSSFYSHVGEYWYEVFSDDRNSVVAFVLDFGGDMHSTNIVDMDTINQTL